ncbi:ankyrin repeat and SOCS box protein 1 isoform X1 [Strigops habroptila]|uniref:ankyrin repeat and SOCS box protein 1 isoform X1 n=1 Tax=Strigops habroptila TaxID=2489341 RepID=UPI0011CFFF37|nr:ankyrin repeat and SOCS box protein 1 isoform X1 [Strigops habroptila]
MAEGGLPGGGDPPAASGGQAGRNLKEWLREQFCDHPIEHCEDTRLHDAAYVGDLPTLKSLLQEESFQSRINEKSVWCCGWLPCTPLRIAATAGHGPCVDFLLRKGAEIDLVDVKGQTALYVAVVNGHLECAKILLEAGADPNGSRHHRSTPVYHAARVGRADILQELIRYGADVDVNHHLPSRMPSLSLRPLTTLVVCPLYISAAYHNLQCFRLLLQAGANPDFNCCGPINIQGFSRGSPVCVMDAVLRHGCEAAFVHLLIDFGANLNLVKVEALGVEPTGRVKVNPEALQVFKEARDCLDFCWEEAHMSCSTWFPLSLSLGGKWDSSGRACRIMEWCLGGPVPESTWTPPTSCPCAGGALHELKRSHQKNVGGRPKLAINAVVSQGGDLEQK